VQDLFVVQIINPFDTACHLVDDTENAKKKFCVLISSSMIQIICVHMKECILPFENLFFALNERTYNSCSADIESRTQERVKSGFFSASYRTKENFSNERVKFQEIVIKINKRKKMYKYTKTQRNFQFIWKLSHVRHKYTSSLKFF
jgi:hypothetical protein